MTRGAMSLTQSTREAELLAELKITKLFLDKLLTGVNDHYVIFDNDFRYVYANDAAARTLGVPREKLIGSVIWELFPEAVGNQFYRELHQVRDSREDIVSEHYYRDWDAWFENRFYALPDGVAVLSIDITKRKQAEVAHRQSEEMLSFALESANMVAWEWEIEKEVVKFSKADNHIYGSKDSYHTSESFSTVYPEDLAAHRQKVMLCAKNGTPYHSNYRIIRPDNGAINWVDEWGFATRDSAGKITKVFGVTMESTERRETEERLQVIYQLNEAVNRAEAVEQIYDLALSGLERVLHVRRAAILTFDRDGVMRFQAWRGLSDRYRALTDGQLPRFINDANPIPVLIPDVAHADLGGQEQNHLNEGIRAIAFIPLVENQRLIGKFILYYDHPHIFTESEVRWAETIAHHVAHALDRKQSEIRLQTYARTLEELNHFQLSLAAEFDIQALLQMITDAATELSGAQFGAFFYNVPPNEVDKITSGEISVPEGNLAKANADVEADLDSLGSYMLYTLSGVPHERFANFPMPRATKIFGPTFRGEGIIRLADVRQDDRFGKNPPYHGMPDGHLPVVSYLAVPVVSRTGEVIGGLFFGHSRRGVFTEQAEQLVSGIASQAAITLENARLYQQIKESETALRELNTTLEQRVEQRTDELQRSNRELDQFAYVASHDLKAPLRAINHLASWIAEDSAEYLPEASKEHLNKLQVRIRRMETLLDDLLAYSRAGRQRHPAELVDITEIVNNVIDMVAAPPGFTIKVVGKLPTLRVERPPLETVFRNLVGNAIKHHPNPSEGIVEISATPDVDEAEQFVEFSIKDNGSGIDPEFHNRIFEMFQTLKPRDMVEGSGVGLAVVKRSVESRGGTIRVESRLGEGATFIFTWPKNTTSHITSS